MVFRMGQVKQTGGARASRREKVRAGRPVPYIEAKQVPQNKYLTKSYLANLPRKDPMVGKQKGACMNKTIWYGAKDSQVRFSEDKNVLANAGINAPQSFTVDGDVTGLKLITEDQQVTAGSSGTNNPNA